eukprot:INCI13456.10.p1 GENE.INCI13456.10~~INCI13456.10.p1  ORF type:complete len:950 (-),score=209.41 INCI13456.10:1722-4571(-)
MIEITTHSGKNRSSSRKKKVEPGRHRGRMSEAAEDAKMKGDDGDNAGLVRITEQPLLLSKVKGKMRDYQLEGLNWMVNLYIKGINGVLADEMGLGKTLQTISLCTFLREAYGIRGKHLVIVPKSTLGNWMREFKVWSPVFKCMKFHGNKESRKILCRDLLALDTFDVCVTTFEMCSTEQTTLSKINWSYIIIDEAHRIKNENSQLSKSVRTFKSDARLLLTGTPLQNNLHELWALLNFLLPNIFGSAEEFDQWFQDDAVEGQESDVVQRLHKILRPFLLRRLKSDVEHSLLPKIETKLYIGMSEMQRYFYRKILSKDTVALNQLGGAGKVRLLNILMQLRKCCNHPYLFKGAEPGPPYEDGPHLWEMAGKMVLLDKLLPKLKSQGSRVLIFSQMTRMLDILEDYFIYKGYDFCRIDGQTKGDDRDDQMDVFNAPGSKKFVFMLTTRAGGLGINLQTADVVILYDSDWNPQADLQAQDRAHRIGQKKQVRIFRFVTEDSVEEKIIERAERKLYTDAVVIQQGRLLQQNRKLSKEELDAMVRFGADTVFKAEGSTITDDDIDAILAKGEEKTAKLNEKLQQNVQHSLSNFSLDSGKSLYDFNDEDFAAKPDHDPLAAIAMVPLQERKRKKNYNESDYYRDLQSVDSRSSGGGSRQAKPKSIQMHDFQFFNQERIKELFQKEFELSNQKRSIIRTVKDMRTQEARERRNAAKAVGEDAVQRHMSIENIVEEIRRLEETARTLELPAEDKAEREALIAQGMGSWTKTDFRKFCAACERHGRKAKAAICADVALSTKNKTEAEVKRYYKLFWERYKELNGWQKILEKIERGEKRIERRLAIERIVKDKVKQYSDPMNSLELDYGSNKGKAFTLEEDRFLICKMAELGYGAWDLLQLEIRKAWQFRFDWFLKSRSTADLSRRCDSLMRIIEREQGKSTTKRKASSSDGGGSKKSR